MTCEKIDDCQIVVGALAECDEMIADANALANAAGKIDTSKAAPVGNALEQAETILNIAAPDAMHDYALTTRAEVVQERLTGGYALYLGQASLCGTCPLRDFMIEPPKQQPESPQ